MLEQYYRMPGRQLLVPVNSQRHLPGRNGFLPDEDKLILEAVAAHLPVQTIATLLPRHSITAIKRQAKAVRASAGREPQVGSTGLHRAGRLQTIMATGEDIPRTLCAAVAGSKALRSLTGAHSKRVSCPRGHNLQQAHCSGL